MLLSSGCLEFVFPCVSDERWGSQSSVCSACTLLCTCTSDRLSRCNCINLMPVFCLFIFTDTAQVDLILILNIQHSLTLDMRYYFGLP